MSHAETLTPWRPVEGISFSFVGAEVWSDYPRLCLRLIDGRTDVHEQQDLCVVFRRAPAYTVHEEFVHPTQGTVFGREPTIGYGSRHTCPLLTVEGSPWFASLADELELTGGKHVHYRFCTAFPVADVASAEPPEVYWLPRRAPAEDAPLPGWVRGAPGAL